MSSSNVTVTKKACDGCKVRKVRCGGGCPCRPCMSAGVQSRVPSNVIASLLYIYHIRMYPVWPIVRVDDLITALEQDANGRDPETRALATGLAAATMAQLKLEGSSMPDGSITSDVLASECLEARKALDYRSRVNLTNIRTAFFLHVYYENRHAGGSESILYLREAITMAQMMYLHREASYASLTEEEQQIRRRVLWLLFVTERGVCILHKLPVVLKTDTAMPDADSDDDAQVLPAFLKLLGLFRLFEQTRMFDIVEDYHLGLQPVIGATSTANSRFDDNLDNRFREISGALDRVSDVQKAEICVTRHWMRILTWKALSHHGSPRVNNSHWHLSAVFPLSVAKDLIEVLYKLPKAALQAHGLGMQLKLHEIANSLADTVTDISIVPGAVQWSQDNRPSHILTCLHSILSALTGGENTVLVDMLYDKVARAHQIYPVPIPTALSSPPTESRRHGTQCSTFQQNDAEFQTTKHDVQHACSDESAEAMVAPVKTMEEDDGITSQTTIQGSLDVPRLPIDDQDPWCLFRSDEGFVAYAADTNTLDASTGSLLNSDAANTMLENMVFDFQRDQSFDAYYPLVNPFEACQLDMINTRT
ncbi:fungal-specific transcription factor domain-containing protein [Aspergillus unguis]